MATYIILSNLTDEGAKTLKNNPERIKEVNQEIETLGVKVLSQYALLDLMISSILWRDRTTYKWLV